MRYGTQGHGGQEHASGTHEPQGELCHGEGRRNDRAWHAGRSSYLAKVECNDYSIGIELEGSDDLPFEDLQYEVLTDVVTAIRQAYPEIKNHIAGHSDIAPGRKTDPGPYFKWQHFRQLLAQKKT